MLDTAHRQNGGGLGQHVNQNGQTWRLYAHVVCCCRRACGKWLPENHLAYVVSDVIDQLDLSAIDEVYGSEKRGQPPYDPRMMTKLLVYGYCVGLFICNSSDFTRRTSRRRLNLSDTKQHSGDAVLKATTREIGVNLTIAD